MTNNNFKETIAGIFTRAAPTYDEVGFKIFKYFGKKLVQFIDIPKKGKILDVASGRGAILFPALKKVGPQGCVIGIDLAEGMVQQTAEDINKRGLFNAKMMLMDAENLKFQDSTFDGIFYGFCIFFFPRHDIALKESYRVLRSNGQIGISTICRETFDGLKWTDDLIENYLPNEFKNAKQAEAPEFDTRDGMQKILIRAGYKDIQSKIVVKEFLCENAEELWKFFWATGSRKSLEKISMENLEKLKKDLTKNFQKYSMNDGLHWNIKAIFTSGRKLS